MNTLDKELIAVAVSVAAGCEPCTQFHVSAARDAGATPEALRRMVELSLTVRANATQRMASVAAQTLGGCAPQPACGGEPLMALEALACAASALAARCGAGVPGFLAQAREAGATDAHGHVALGIARAIVRVADEKAETAAKGSPDTATACGCAAATAQPPSSGCCGN
jgi:AhpD family alkylhydroperoxidase